MDDALPQTTATATATTTATPTAGLGGGIDNDDAEAFLAPFSQHDFDPVAYAASASDSAHDQDSLALMESRLAFAAQDLSRQIDALVVQHHATLRATVHLFDKQHAHVTTHLRPQLGSVAAQCIQWRASVAHPADQLRSTLAQARASRDIASLARLLSHVTAQAASLPDLPTHIADPESLPDLDIPSLASTLADLASTLALVDLSNIDMVDSVIAPHIAGCRAALLARCNAMVHPKDLARTKLALNGLATLGVLADWHALRRAKIVAKLETTLKEWVDAVCAAEQPPPPSSSSLGKARKSSTPASSPQAVFAQFNSKVADFLAAEARFFHSLLTAYPLPPPPPLPLPSPSPAPSDPWSDFWSSVASTLDRHLGASSQAQASSTIPLGYPSLYASLTDLANRIAFPIPLDLAHASLSSLQPHSLARIQALIQSSLTSLFQPQRTSSSSASSSAAVLPPVPSCGAIDSLIASWTAHLPPPNATCTTHADQVGQAVAAGLAQLTAALLSLCSDSILLVELFADTPTPPQMQIVHVARAMLYVYVCSSASAAAAGDHVQRQLDRTLADAAQLVDIAMQAVVGATHSAILDTAAIGASFLASSPAAAVLWAKPVTSRLATARDLLAALLPLPPPAAATSPANAHMAALVTHWRHVLVGTLLQHVPACIALATRGPQVADHAGRLRLVDALAALETHLAALLPPGGAGSGAAGLHGVPTFRHLQALRTSVLAGEAAAGEAADGGGWARASRWSPVLVGTYYAMVVQAADTDRWMGRGESKGSEVRGARHVDRHVVGWVLAWVERWDAAEAGAGGALGRGEEDKARVWSEWGTVMDRVLGEGGWHALVGEMNEAQLLQQGEGVKVEDE